MNQTIVYKKRRHYKYTLHENFHLETSIYPDQFISTRFIDLGTRGWLTIKRSYAWD